jgi:hypothetical protein
LISKTFLWLLLFLNCTYLITIMENFKKITIALMLIIATLTTWSCEEGEGSSSTKPKARGAIGEIWQ